MPTIEIPKDQDIYQSIDSPIEAGDIKIVTGTPVLLDDCETADQWSVISGAGVTISSSTYVVKEGAYSVRVHVPAGITGVVKCTKTSGSWDLSNLKYLKIWLFNYSPSQIINNDLFFGETVYNEQSSDLFTIPQLTWYQKSWDISVISNVDKNEVTIFAISFPNVAAYARSFYLDYLYADAGPSSIEGFDGDRIIGIYPKKFEIAYTGDGIDDRAIAIPRAKHPTNIRIIKAETGDTANNSEIWWNVNMVQYYSQDVRGQAAPQTDMIKTVTVGQFTLGTDLRVNANGKYYIATIEWED